MRKITLENQKDGQVTARFDTDNQDVSSFCFSVTNIEDALKEFMAKFGSGTRQVFTAVEASSTSPHEIEA